jgi:hypothetical protein
LFEPLTVGLTKPSNRGKFWEKSKKLFGIILILTHFW